MVAVEVVDEIRRAQHEPTFTTLHLVSPRRAHPSTRSDDLVQASGSVRSATPPRGS